MSDEGPKLFSSKPKKTKLKASNPIPMASSSSTGAAPPPPPPPPPSPLPQDSFARRYKLFGKFVLGFSVIAGAYALLRTVMIDEKKSEEVKPVSSSVAAISEKANTQPIQRPPIPEDEQRELFKWLLQEKRKVKAKDAQEKKCLDEEKAILKQFIRAKSLPSI